MMDLLRITFGDDRIVGRKWPREPEEFKQGEDESDAEWELRQHRETQTGDYAKSVERFKKSVDMNPNGFWEMEWSVVGIPSVVSAKEKVQEAIDKRGIVKVVSGGLSRSTPESIGKVIYMLRHPRAVAKSQEKLVGQFGPTDNPELNGEEVRKHSPGMYARTTIAVANWLSLTGAECLIVDFDDLIENPAKTLFTVQEFLAEGDFTQAINRVNPKLRRSYPQDIDNPLWPCVEEMYELMGKREFAAVADVKLPDTGEEGSTRFCHRLERQVVENECNLCRTEPNTRANYKRTATGPNRRWYKNPCAWEVVNDGVSVEDSIAKAKAELTVDVAGFDLDEETTVLEDLILTNANSCDIEQQRWVVAVLLGIPS
jgi:hypothetical protein